MVLYIVTLVIGRHVKGADWVSNKICENHLRVRMYENIDWHPRVHRILEIMIFNWNCLLPLNRCNNSQIVVYILMENKTEVT